jgi:hypothetical protein
VYGAGAPNVEVGETLPGKLGQLPDELEGFDGACVRSAAEVVDASAGVAAVTHPIRAAKELGLQAEAHFCCSTGILTYNRVCLWVLGGCKSVFEGGLLREGCLEKVLG